MHQARKRFGQNFLHDQSVIAEIIHAIAPRPSDHMVEIGPGLGALTHPLLAVLPTLTVVELDRDLIERLKKNEQLVVHEQDALQFDFSSLAAPLRVVGNLPYNISTPLLFHLLTFTDHIEDMLFMLQNEVVDRICAKHGSKTYGRLSVMMQYFCEVEKCFLVPPEAFRPAPKVDSAIIRLTPHKTKPHVLDADVSNKDFETLLRTAFSQRRKTLRNNLKNDVDTKTLDALDFDLSLRPEMFSVADFVALANALNK
jgi:16S rRNA (adenine1518-N6/adenine1519-N6)-dimethyltransferase